MHTLFEQLQTATAYIMSFLLMVLLKTSLYMFTA